MTSLRQYRRSSVQPENQRADFSSISVEFLPDDCLAWPSLKRVLSHRTDKKWCTTSSGKNWLLMVDPVASHGPVNGKRHADQQSDLLDQHPVRFTLPCSRIILSWGCIKVKSNETDCGWLMRNRTRLTTTTWPFLDNTPPNDEWPPSPQ